MQRLNTLLAVVLFLYCSGNLSAEPFKHKATGLELADKIEILKKGKVTDFEAKYPGLGVSVGYNFPGIVCTVYIYNFREKSLPDDLSSEMIKKHFEKVVEDVFTAGKRGMYKNVKKVSEGEVSLKEGDKDSPKALTATLSFKVNGGDCFSKVYLMTFKNHYVKIRYTYNQDVKDQAEKVLKQLLESLADSMKKESR